MSTLRSDLYKHYVSNFKNGQLCRSNVELHSFFAWSEHKYLPLLSGLNRSARILELGCGPGLMMLFLQQQGFKDVVGIDASMEQVALARQSGLHADVGDVFEYLAHLGTASLDLVVAIDFLEHFSKDEAKEILTATRRSLCPRGTLILQTPNGQGLFPGQVAYGDLTHMTIFNPGSLSQLLRLCGMDNIRFYETGPASDKIVGRVRQAIWSVTKLAANVVRLAETGKRQELWTENMICVCQKPSM